MFQTKLLRFLVIITLKIKCNYYLVKQRNVVMKYYWNVSNLSFFCEFNGASFYLDKCTATLFGIFKKKYYFTYCIFSFKVTQNTKKYFITHAPSRNGIPHEWMQENEMFGGGSWLFVIQTKTSWLTSNWNNQLKIEAPIDYSNYTYRNIDRRNISTAFELWNI